MSESPPSITELIEQLEQIREEHGDLPVVYVNEGFQVGPDPTVTEDTPISWEFDLPSSDIEETRVEL